MRLSTLRRETLLQLRLGASMSSSCSSVAVFSCCRLFLVPLFHFARFASVSAGNVVCTRRRVQDRPAWIGSCASSWASLTSEWVQLTASSPHTRSQNFHILNCTNPRVLSFPGVIQKFLRGIFFHERRLRLEIHLKIVCHFFCVLVSLAFLRTWWKLYGRTSTRPCRWLASLTLQWSTSTIFSILLFVDTVSWPSTGCSAITLLVVLLTSSSISPLFPDCVAESSFFSAGCITCSPDPSRL